MSTITSGSNSAHAAAETLPARLMSLDIFRGLTIAGMILVNNPGSWRYVYAPLLHAPWHGWTPTDLIFPFFLFIVGVSMIFSFAARLKRGHRRADLLRHVMQRSAIIFFLGLFLNAFPFFQFTTMRLPGVLQRIALCYFFAALIVLASARRGQLVFIVALLGGYWALLALVPVPGYGIGRLDPDGNLAAYVDRRLMLGHLWKPTWDPEGLLSTLPAIATTLLGALTGQWLRSHRPPPHKAAGLIAMGAVGLVAGELLHLWFPINKNLWTSSYVIFTAGFAALLLGLCYWLADVKGYRRWGTPFVIFGRNAIAVFTLASLVAKAGVSWKLALPDGHAVFVKTYLFECFFAPLASPNNASLLFALTYTLCWLALMALLYRKQIFIKI